MAQAVGSLFQLLATVAADPSILAPVKPWGVEYADNMCVLSRDFGGTKETPATTLALRPVPLGDQTEITLVTAPDGMAKVTRGKLRLTLLPSGAQEEVVYDRRRHPTTGRDLTEFDVSSGLIAAMESAQTVEVAIGRQAPVRLATGNAAKAFAALRPCQDDLLRTWGYDPSIRDRIATPARPVGGGLGTWFQAGYYPLEALRMGQEGRTTVAWTINADGRISDCRVLNSSGSRALDLTTCAVFLQKGRYKPAIGHDGRRMATYQMMNVRWAMPTTSTR